MSKLKKLFDELKITLLTQDCNDCHRIIKELNYIYRKKATSQENESKIALLCDTSSGGLHCLSFCLNDTSSHKCTVKLAKCLSYQVAHFTKCFLKYAGHILTVSVMFMKSSKLKLNFVGAEILNHIILSKEFYNLDWSSVMSVLLEKIQNVDMTVKSIYYKLLGALGEHLGNIRVDRFSEIRNVLLRDSKQLCEPAHAQASHGFLEAVSNFCTLHSDLFPYLQVYNILKSVLLSDHATKLSYCVALKLLQRHLAHLVSFMTSDFEEWHNMFSINITECSDVFLKESKSVREVSAAFYHAASQHTNATHLQRFCQSIDALYSRDAGPPLHLVRCFRNLINGNSDRLPDQDQVFYSLACQFTRACTRAEKRNYIGTYLECLAILIFYKKSVSCISAHQEDVVVKFLLFVIRNYSNMQGAEGLVASLHNALCCVHSCKPALTDYLVSQSLIFKNYLSADPISAQDLEVHVSLWQGLMASELTGSSQPFIYDCFVKQAILLFEELELTRSNEQSADMRPLCDELGTSLESLIYLIDRILNENKTLFLKTWTKLFSYNILRLSMEIPNICGIYRILSIGNESVDLTDELKDGTAGEIQKLLLEISTFILDLLRSTNKCKRIKKTLFKFLSIFPDKIVVIFLDETMEIFIDLFKSETFDQDVMLQALLCLENWLRIVDKIKMDRFLETIYPHMKYFIHSQCDCVNVQFNSQDKYSTRNTKWSTIQEKLAIILKTNRETNKPIVIGPTKFTVSIAFPHQIIKVDISVILIHVIHLCMNSEIEDSVRLYACEVLHVAASSLIGQCASLKLEEQIEHVCLFEMIFHCVLKLGCDGNSVIRALFRALSLQISRAVSSVNLCEPFAVTFINLLGRADRAHDGVRDLAATCGKEFFHCVLDNRSVDICARVQPYFDIIIHGLSDIRIQSVAMKMLSRILPELLEDVQFLNNYYIHVIHSLICSLNLNPMESDDADAALVVVCNAVEKCGPVICQDNVSRMQPFSFEGRHILDLLIWLLEQCYTGNDRCRASITKVYTRLRNVCVQENLKLEPPYSLEHLEVSILRKVSLTKLQFMPWMSSATEITDVLKWVKLLNRLLECYQWLVTNLKVDLSCLERDINLIFGIQLYMEVICNIEQENDFFESLSTRLENHNFESLKAATEMRKTSGLLAIKILELFTILPLKLFIHADNFSNMLLRCVTQPTKLGIELNEQNDKLLTSSVKKIIKSLNENYKDLWRTLRGQILSALTPAYRTLSDNLKRILKGKLRFTDCHINVISCMKCMLAVEEDTKEMQEIILHLLENLPVVIKSGLKDDGGVYLRRSHNTLGVTADLITLQLATQQYQQQVWQDLTHCNCRSFEHIDYCVCQIYFTLFIDVFGKHILGRCDKVEIGNLCSKMKLNVINNLLQNFHYDLLKRFLSILKYAIIGQSRELINWANRNANNLKVFTNLLHNFSSYDQQMTNEYMLKDCLVQTHFQGWIFNLLQENVFKIDFLPFIIYFSPKLFESFMSYVNECSRDSVKRIWNNLILNFDVTKNELILSHLLESLCKNSLSVIATSYSIIMNHVDRLSNSCQLHILKTAHQISINPTIGFKHRNNFVKQFYLVLLQNMATSVTVEHYQCIFKELYSYDKPENWICYKVVMLQLLEVMFGTLDRTVLEETVLKNCEESMCYSSLVCELISRCYSVRKQLQNDIDIQLWRIYQCASFNCLITLLARNYEDGFSYNFFLFREKFNESSVWENLVDKNISLVFPAIKSAMEKCYPSFIRTEHEKDTETNSTSTIVSQECKLYDFVGHHTTPKDKRVYIGCNLEIDHLNKHECMGTICALITRIGRTNAQADKMPMWMKSFNNSLRNPKLHPNASAFIIKVVYNTREIFHCFAMHWMGPILYAVNSGVCGTGVNQFYCQIVSMLVSWHNIAVPDANSNEKKYASNIVALLMTNIVGKGKKEVKRNYELLSSCLIKWKGLLECSIQTVIQITKSRDGVELRTGLNTLLLYLKSYVMPFTIQERKKFFNILVILSKNVIQSINKVASELIGLFLVKGGEQISQSEVSYYERIVKQDLISIYCDDKAAFVLRLEKIALHYGEIVDRHNTELLTYICITPKLQPLHAVAIDILCRRCCYASTEFEGILSHCGIFHHISLRSEDDQLNILKLLRHLCISNMLMNIEDNLDQIVILLRSMNFKLLTTTWNLLVHYVRKKSLDWSKINNEVILCRLLAGIWNYDKATHHEALSFLVEVVAKSSGLLEVLILLLDNLTEFMIMDRNCVAIILEVMLEISVKSPSNSQIQLPNVFKCYYKSFEFENEEYSILFNSYKFGDFPHTETNYGVIAKLLQNLGKTNFTCGCQLLLEIVNGLLQQVKDELVKQSFDVTISNLLKIRNMDTNLRHCLEKMARSIHVELKRNNEELGTYVGDSSNEAEQEPLLKRLRNTD
ncbi:DNA-dependent protein kinase catalytic subunit-like isoform X3 [Rhodnius prolixus]|uniref:DNA-dependent protein kinase catalytic subunit-like isoform X3 n=1 Tax=Rhodnius prolixus TaxID=13249 RepID=UPI003D188E15